MRTYFLIIHRILFFLFLILLSGGAFLCSCQSEESAKYATEADLPIEENRSSIRYASGFDLVSNEKLDILHIFRHFNKNVDTLSYLLAAEGSQIPGQYGDLTVISVPVQRIALLHSSYVSYFDFCESKDHIKAISEVQYVYDSSIYESVSAGQLPEVGYGETLDKEKLLALDIDLVISVGWPNSPNKSQHALEELGIPMLLFSEWQESTLLGRMEWVKIIAALTGKKEIANHRFNQVAYTYDSLKILAQKVDHHPGVLFNLPYKGSWHVPGGRSYMSHLIRDAGGSYLWAEDQGTGGLQLDFETVYAKGIAADVWINPGVAHRISEILAKDERLHEFKAIRDENVFNAINRMAHGQANDYWESALVNPHLVLADMIRILHPDIMPNHDLVYFKKIR
jgi:iron complex transport system substrate-binding protein